MSFILEKPLPHPAIASLGPVCQNPTLDLDGSSIKTSTAAKLFHNPCRKINTADQYRVPSSPLPRLAFWYLTLLWQIPLQIGNQWSFYSYCRGRFDSLMGIIAEQIAEEPLSSLSYPWQGLFFITPHQALFIFSLKKYETWMKAVSTLFPEAFEAQITDKDLLWSSVLSLLACAHPAAVEKRKRGTKPSPYNPAEHNPVSCICLGFIIYLATSAFWTGAIPASFSWEEKIAKLKVNGPEQVSGIPMVRWFRPGKKKAYKECKAQSRH